MFVDQILIKFCCSWRFHTSNSIIKLFYFQNQVHVHKLSCLKTFNIIYTHCYWSFFLMSVQCAMHIVHITIKMPHDHITIDHNLTDCIRQLSESKKRSTIKTHSIRHETTKINFQLHDIKKKFNIDHKHESHIFAFHKLNSIYALSAFHTYNHIH